MILEDLSEAKWLRRLIVAVLLAVLVLLAFQVLQPFIVPVIWAVILAYVTWPVHGRLVRLCGGRRELAALLMTLLLSAAIVLPVVWLVLLVQSEALPVYRELAPLISKVQLPPVIAELPMLGPRLQEILAQVAKDPGAIDTAIRNFLNQSSGEMAALIGGVGRNLVKLVIAMVSLFFMYRDGEYFASQVERVLQQLFSAGARPADVGVISPYSGQVQRILDRCARDDDDDGMMMNRKISMM
jgi:predicted PurR-regulated permease PerM